MIKDRISIYTWISYIIFPILTNLFLLLFIFFSIDIYSSSSERRNIIGVVAFFVDYIGGLLLFVAYGKSTNGWFEMFGDISNTLFIVGIVLTYPVFFLFWLPYVLYHFLSYRGSPKGLWEKIFLDTTMSLDNLIPEFSENTCQLVCRYIYIGIPFLIFATIYIAIIIFFLPLWYFVTSPNGFGTIGICIHVSYHFPSSSEMHLLQRILVARNWGSLTHNFIIALPSILISIIYCSLVNPSWFAVLLAIFSCLQFVTDVVPSIIRIIRKPVSRGLYL